MAHTNSTAKAIQEMVRFFLPRCADQSTLRELDDMSWDDQKWRYAHALFSRIRDKTLRADKAKDELLQHQYSFEEICAKTLYNMSGHTKGTEFPYRFDDDCRSGSFRSRSRLLGRWGLRTRTAFRPFYARPARDEQAMKYLLRK